MSYIPRCSFRLKAFTQRFNMLLNIWICNREFAYEVASMKLVIANQVSGNDCYTK